MTAPGNSALLITMLAVFLACCGYAAGRLHQRYQMERDREEAYRDGYDTATRSVFSLAARVIAPRRGVRATVPATVPVALGEPPVSPPPQPSGPGVAGLLRRSAVPGSAAGAVAAEADDAESLGFPVPPPPSSRVVAEPAAVGGVVYQQFPDPRAVEVGPVGDRKPASPEPAAGASDGRHTVPDELVQAATYRLPPDRIFRAKVPDSTLPEEPTTRLSVPKPRHS
jgi:hypothetical protein